MAKCGSSRRSSEPLQGKLLVVLVVFAASLDAGRVMAWDVEQQLLDSLETMLLKGAGKLKMSEKFKEFLEGFKAGRKGYKTGKKLYNLLVEQVPAEVIASVSFGRGPKLPVLGVDISSRAMAKIGSCAATTLGVSLPFQVARIISLYGRLSSTTPGGQPMVSVFGARFLQCPGGGTSAVVGLGWGGELERRSSLKTFTFSYLVVQEPRGGSVNAFAWIGRAWQPGLPRSTPLVFNPMNPNMYYVTITRILVDNQDIMQAPLGIIASLSTTEPFTNLESGAYVRLKDALVQRLLVNGVAPANNPNQLCYTQTAKLKAVRFPSVSIEFANNANNAVMHLGAANLLQSRPDGYDCLAIRPTPFHEFALGSMLQSGTTMTIQVVPRGREGTLTFHTPV